MHPFGCGSVWGWGNEAIDVLTKLSKKMTTQLLLRLYQPSTVALASSL